MAKQCFSKMNVAVLCKVGYEEKKVGRSVRKLLYLTLREVIRAWTKVVEGNQDDISSFFLFTPSFSSIKL